MTKTVFFVIVVFISIEVQAQASFSSLVRQLKRESKERVDIRLSKLPLIIAAPFFDKKMRKWLYKTNYVQLVACGGARQESRIEQIQNQLVNSMRERNFDPLLSVRDGEDKINVFVRMKNDESIREFLLMINEDNRDFVLIRLKGHFRLGDMEAIQKSLKKKIS